ncbi:ribbon-helix-helix protein, CopG family [Candidatus Azambacteria bacterium]|nr:ribbon-helix-helix protein, CopG family [Candidatus Azambacteria bacterium]
MRTTLNISMPVSLKKNVDLAVKEGNYASVSEFFRDAIRAWEEEQLYQSVMRSELEFANGKGKRLRSLKDLM